VLFSCKITHSIITYLDRRGEDQEVLYEKCDWPAEFLRDPSCWLEAEKMENFLRRIEQDYGRETQTADGLIVAVGHLCKDLRSWGVLDSVLRMVQTPKDLFAQPERFLSYFVSPAPPVGEIRREPDTVSFVLPISAMQFPLVTSYLRAALEALPTYINKPMATVRWDESRVHISWSEHQASLFGEAQNTELSLHPELVRNILMNLESSQKELEEMKLQLRTRDQEIAVLRDQLHAATSSQANLLSERSENIGWLARDLDHELTEPVSRSLNEAFRIGDYMARGQQLITLLVAQGRQTPQVQEAMRRVDWPFVVAEGPQIVKRVIEDLQAMQKIVRDLRLIAALQVETGGLSSREAGVEIGVETDCDLNLLVDRAVELALDVVRNPARKSKRSSSASASVSANSSVKSSGVKIDRQPTLDRQVRVRASLIEQAVVNVLGDILQSVSSDGDGGVIRVATRARGPRAEIEISMVARSREQTVFPLELGFEHLHGHEHGHELATKELTAKELTVTEFTESVSSKLGLRVAQAIVRLHGGTLTVKSGLSDESGRAPTMATVISLPFL